ncbi:MAG: FeoA family protein [Planctomycetaceae bacterium]
MKLSELRPGQSGIVSELCQKAIVSGRLMEMGLIPGEVVEVIRRAPFGDPVEYRIRGVRISMRSSDASCVTVVPVSERVPA